MIKIITCALALTMIASSAATAQQRNDLSCANWNANRYDRSAESLAIKMWAMGFVAALEEEWLAEGEQLAEHPGFEALFTEISRYCQQLPGGIVQVAARNAAERLYRRGRHGIRR